MKVVLILAVFIQAHLMQQLWHLVNLAVLLLMKALANLAVQSHTQVAVNLADQSHHLQFLFHQAAASPAEVFQVILANQQLIYKT